MNSRKWGLKHWLRKWKRMTLRFIIAYVIYTFYIHVVNTGIKRPPVTIKSKGCDRVAIDEKCYEAIFFNGQRRDDPRYCINMSSLSNVTLPQLKMNGSFHVITTFFVHTDPQWSANLWNFDTDKSATVLDLLVRHKEVLSCLKANLLHGVVASVNILHNS